MEFRGTFRLRVGEVLAAEEMDLDEGKEERRKRKASLSPASEDPDNEDPLAIFQKMKAVSFSEPRADEGPVTLPLKSVSVQAAVVHSVAQVEVTQVYRNDEDIPIEAVCSFPIGSFNGAVTNFTAEVGVGESKRVIKGGISASSEARLIYKRGGSNLGPAFLCEEGHAGVIKISVCHVQPKAEVKVIISYLKELTNLPDTPTLRFLLPASTFSTFPSSVKVVVSLQGKIKALTSPSHENLIVVECKGEIPQKPGWFKSLVTFESQGESPGGDFLRDFILLISPEEMTNNSPRIYAETSPLGSTVVMANIIPTFTLTKDKLAEIVVIMDHSLVGESAGLGQKAVECLLTSLPCNCYFNLITFTSSHHQALFKSGSRRFNRETFRAAITWINELKPGREGDFPGNLVLPLKKVLERRPIPRYYRQVVVVSSGFVSNVDQIIGLVGINAESSRVFSLGLSSTLSSYFLQGIAKAGRGTCSIINTENEIEAVIKALVKNCVQPELNDLKIEWTGIPEVELSLSQRNCLIGHKPITNSNDGQSVFSGTQLVVYGHFHPDRKPDGVKVTVNSPDGPLTLNMNITEEDNLGSTKMLHRMYAIKRIRDFEVEAFSLKWSPTLSQSIEDKLAELKEKITEIALENGISSLHSSFVCVDEFSKDCRLAQTRLIPSLHFNLEEENHRLPEATKLSRKIIRTCLKRARKGTFYSRKRKTRVKVRQCGSYASTVPLLPLPVIMPMDTEEETEQKEDEDFMDQLVSLQNPDGSFPLTKSIAKILSLDFREIEEKGKTEKWEESTWVTALVLQFLKRKRNSPSSGGAVVKKAENWLGKTNTHSRTMEQSAESFFL